MCLSVIHVLVLRMKKRIEVPEALVGLFTTSDLGWVRAGHTWKSGRFPMSNNYQPTTKSLLGVWYIGQDKAMLFYRNTRESAYKKAMELA
jgi:hypothetical protein